MTKVTIHGMRRPAEPNETCSAVFTCEVDVWKMHGLRIAEKPDGFVAVYGPRTTNRVTETRRAVEPPDEIWRAIVKAALNAYDELRDDEPDAGLARFLGLGQRESLDLAGL